MHPDNFPARTFDALKNARMALTATAGLLLVGGFAPEAFVVHASDPLSRQAELALPSALQSGSGLGGLLPEAGMAALSIETARRTSTLKELGATAVGAQIASCAADAVADRTWLTTLERSQADVGFSAISVALLTKFLLDRSASAENPQANRRWKAGALALAAFMTAGLYLVDGSSAGKLDITAHGAGFITGAVAYRLGNWRKQHKPAVNQKLRAEYTA